MGADSDEQLLLTARSISRLRETTNNTYNRSTFKLHIGGVSPIATFSTITGR